MVAVVDEYGGVSCIVTLENVIEGPITVKKMDRVSAVALGMHSTR